MASFDKITVDVCVTIPDETVVRCLRILSMYLTDNPDKTLSIDNVNVDGKEKRYMSIRNIVHCEDCIYADEYNHCDRVHFWNRADDFCSKGERKDGRDNTETE